MSRTPPSYGRRGRLNDANTGIRHTAPTYGKPRYGTYSEKASGHLDVESDAERFIAHLLTIDPRVTAFEPQPFCVDLIEQRLLLTKEAVRTAVRRYHHLPGPKFYTPDFGIDWENGLHHALEVKAEGFEGDDEYLEKLARADPILEANGYPLSVLVFPADTAHPIRMNARLLKLATHQLGTYLSNDLVERVTHRCESGPMAMRSLCADLAIATGLIPLLLVSGVLKADLFHHAIDGALELSLAYGDLSHLCLLERVER